MNALTLTNAGDESTTNAIANTEFTADKFFATVRQFGRDFGNGMASRPRMAVAACEAAAYLTDIGPDQATEIYTQFQQAAKSKKGIEYSVEASFKVQVSKLKQFLIVGTKWQDDGVEMLNRAEVIIDQLSKMDPSPLKGSAYDNLVNIAREQNKHEDHVLTDDEIEALISKQIDPKTAVQKLESMYKQMVKIQTGSQDEAGLDNAVLAITIDNLKATILDLGGELPAITKDDMEKAKLAKLLQKHMPGVTITPV